jgi:hypothetical protein
MKKQLILIPLMAGLFFSCKKDKKQPPENMVPTKISYYYTTDLLASTTTITYNGGAKPAIITCQQYDNGGLPLPSSTQENYTYDGTGKLMTRTYGSRNASTEPYVNLLRWAYSYDANGKLLKVETFDATNTLTSRNDYTYPSASTIEFTLFSVSANAVTLRKVFSFDAKGNLINEKSYNGSNVVTRNIDYAGYDDKNNPNKNNSTAASSYTPVNNYGRRNVSGDYTENTNWAYIYNESGYPTQAIGTDAGNGIREYKVLYEYKAY